MLNVRIKNYLEDFHIFKQILSRQISFIKEKYKSIDFCINIINEKELATSFIIFSNLNEHILGNINEDNNIENEKYNIIMNFAEDIIQNYKYNLLYYWNHFLIITLIIEIKSFLIEKETNDIEDNTQNINKLIYILEKNNDIITILFKKKRIGINQILSLLNIYIIWIEENYNKKEFSFDKYTKIKNYFLLKLYFNFLKNIFLIELNFNKEENEIMQFFSHLNKFCCFDNIKSYNNNIVIANNPSFQNFSLSILKNIDFSIYLKYKKNLLNFFKKLIKSNVNKSKIIDKIVNNLKKSFLNLNIIEFNKNSSIVTNDLLIQNFFLELLCSLFEENSTNLDNFPFFNFNGIDSKMSFKLTKYCLLNTLIVFSFCLNIKNINSSNQNYKYPLFTIYDESKNINIFKLYIKKKFKWNKYFLYIKEQGKAKHISLDNLQFIENNKYYYIALNLEEKSINVYLDKEKTFKEIKIKEFYKNEDYIIQIGYDKFSKEFFKGLIGPLVIFKNKEISKRNIKLISKIFYSKDKYPYIIYSLCNSTIYKFDYNDNFGIESNIILNNLNELKNKFECIFYLSPYIIESYSNIQESNFQKYYLPLVPNICENQNKYNIMELNISLMKKENITKFFLMNNGLYLICLQFEYLYQLSINIYKKIEGYDNEDKFYINEETKEIINNILNNSIKVLIKYKNQVFKFYGLFKMIFLNMFNCIKSFNQFNIKLISDSVIKELGNLIFLIIEDINNKTENKSKNNTSEENNIKKYITFRDGLIDFLLTYELYDNANFEIIQYIFTILLSIKTKVKDNLFLSNKNILWKILSFIQLLENIFNNDENKIDENSKNIKSKIFDILKEYFLCLKYEEESKILFSDFLHFCLNSNKDKYYLIYNYFILIYELIINEFYFEDNELQLLINYLYELINKNNSNKEDNINNQNNINIKNENINNNFNNNNINCDNKEIIQKVIIIILKILIDLVFSNLSIKEINKNMIKLINSIELTKEILCSICKEIVKIITFLFNNTNIENNSYFKLYINNNLEKKSPKIFSRLFKFIYTILNLTINNNYNKEKYNITKTKLTNEVLSLLITINKKINEELQKEKKNKHIYLFLINYIKFLYKIVFNNNLFNNFSLFEIDMFIFNLTDLVHLFYTESILFTNFLIQLKVDNKYLQKTIIEIIVDIYIKIIFNEKFLKTHKLIYESLNSIFDNITIENKLFTIFYYNDYLINLFNKKRIGKEEQKIREKIKYLNDILIHDDKEKFEMSFITFFLLKIAAYFVYLQNNYLKNDDCLKNYLDQLIKKLYQEHEYLYKLNKNIFSKSSNNNYYNCLKEKIEKNILSQFNLKNKSNKNIDIFIEFKEFCFDKLSNFSSQELEKITSGNCSIKKEIGKRNKSLVIITEDNNINIKFTDNRKFSLRTNLYKNPRNKNNNDIENIEPSFSYKNNTSLSSSSLNNLSSKVNMHNNLSNIEKKAINEKENDKELENELELSKNNKKLIFEDNKNETNYEININIESKKNNNIENDLSYKQKIKLKQINLTEYINSIFFFENIDINYIVNYKKELMSKIFSIYFLDVFFSNELFKKMKIFYLNEYKMSNYYTKMLNFPSTLKHFSNGLEPGMLLKQHNNFFDSKYFPISHPYFVDYIRKNNAHNMSIKLYQKKLPKYLFNNNETNLFKINCELIKIDHEYFGQIIGCNLKNKEQYLVFQEKELELNCKVDNIFDIPKNYEFLFSMSFSNYLNRIKKKNNQNLERKRKKKKGKIILILFSEIEEIIERRFLLMWQGIEIFLKNGKSYYFNLFSEERNNRILDFFRADDNIKNLIHSRDYLFKEKEISKKWKNYHLQTYEYLLLINKYGSRTFKDNCQYPIFPWLLVKDYEKIEEINNINDTESDILIAKFFNNKGENIKINKRNKEIKELFKSIRKMKYPICIQSEEKIKSFIEKYLEEDDNFRYHLGIHYSTSSYIYYYLMRQEPYSDLLIKLQNYQQENPNRMFIGVNESISLLEKSKDPREIIPELFTRFEYLLNLNCNFFGIKNDKKIVDDNLINFFDKNKNSNPFYNYINFIIEHHKLLNSKIISIIINDWIDNVFGINQIPSNKKNREICCNIFMKSSYEQEFNLKGKLDKYLGKIKNGELSQKEALKKILSKINSILNFGQTPYQIFKEKHYKREINGLNIIENKDKIEENENDDELKIDAFENVYKILKTQSLTYDMRGDNNYIYFDINHKSNKIFVLSEERNLEIISTELYNNKGSNQYSLSYHYNAQLPHFLFNEKIIIGIDQYNIQYYYIYKFKYAFSSFDDIEEAQNYKNIDTKELFHTYGRKLIEKILKNKDKEKNIDKNSNKKNELNEHTYSKFISCRYIDKSFKIHRFPKNKYKEKKEKKENKDNNINMPISFICEDFVCSCCVLSFCQFLIGLKNGKLIQFYLEKQENNNKKKSNEENIEKYQLIIEKYIQAHKGGINVIEIDKKNGILITCGDDNYIFLRKLYDFELLSLIKLKSKFIITMARVSPLNFLYIICFNKEKRSSIIFGYTLTGLKFAKSKYGFYDNIDFTLNGNIVTLVDHKDLCILSGSNLNNIIMNENESNYDDFIKKKDKVRNSIWLRYNYFIRESEEEDTYNKIITYYKIEDNKKLLATLDVSQNKYFE